MIIGTIKETALFETRVAITPDTADKLIKAGFKVIIEQSAGQASGFDDKAYQTVGASLISDPATILNQTDILLKIQAPSSSEIAKVKPHCFIISNFQLSDHSDIAKLQAIPTTCFALEKLPRLSKTQPFDILSSQNNLSGYQAVLKAATLSSRSFPLMITSAGTLLPLKILIIGIGVAGLQAIATAKRLGAKVYASDLRPETQEQAQSLGAIFLNDFFPILPECDIIITSAFSAGKKAPQIINRSTLKNLHSGTILIDMASAFGGNIEGSKNFELINFEGCFIYGNSNLSAEIPTSASILFANNLYNFVMSIYNSTTPNFIPDFNDPIISQTAITKG